MKMTSTKRFAVRTALVTSTTLATIIGAQALASLDAAARAQPTPAPIIAFADPVLYTQQPVSAAAPNIVILRHASEASAPAISIQTQTPAQQPAGTANQSVAHIQPPNPVQVVPPAPVVQPMAAQPVPVTRSSR